MNHSAVHTNILGTEDQLAKEKLATHLRDSAPVQKELQKLEKLYRDDPAAKSPSGSSQLQRAMTSLAMVAAGYAANGDADRPTIMWATTSAHTWFGIDVPESFYAIDAPDNIYRSVFLDGAARYEIRGKVNPPAPSQLTFVLFSAIPGVIETMNSEGHMVELGGLKNTTMAFAADGTFVVTVDSDPANGRPNHIQAPADNPHMLLLVRDTLSDWSKENPVSLTVHRIAGPPLKPAPTVPELEKYTAEVLAAMGPYWRKWFNARVYTLPLNEITTPWARLTGWGYASFGHFAFADDEAWVMTLSSMGADYFGLQLADPWGIAIENRHRSGSLNQSQAKPNADGTFTFVAAAHDPGVHNWLDTNGLHAGVFTGRWQGVTSAKDAVRMTKIVKLKDVKSILPSDTVFVNAEQRKAQLAARAASYARRLGI